MPGLGLAQDASDAERKEWVVKGCTTAGIGCLECKQPVIDAINRERRSGPAPRPTSTTRRSPRTSSPTAATRRKLARRPCATRAKPWARLPVSVAAKVYGEPVIDLPHDLYIPPDALEIVLEAFEAPRPAACT